MRFEKWRSSKPVSFINPTFHHFFHEGYDGFGKSPEHAAELFNQLPHYEVNNTKFFEPNSIMPLLKQNANKLRNRTKVAIHIGTADILYCENELMHLYLGNH